MCVLWEPGSQIPHTRSLTDDMDLLHLILIVILSTGTSSSTGGCYNCLHHLFRETSGLVWLRNGHENRDGETCSQMSLGSGQWTNSRCNQKHRFICSKQISVSLPSSDSYIIGVPLMSGVYTHTQLHVVPSPPDLQQQTAEMMFFPGIWASHEGQVLSVELVAQPSQQLTMAKVQILRPYCSPSHHLVPPGCSSILNPFTCCSVKPLCNTTGGCPSGQYWCHLIESCLSVTSPCSPYRSSSEGHIFALPPRYTAMTPFYHIVADIALEIPPASEPVHITVTFKENELLVFPDDILAVQHTRKSGEFLLCTSDSDSTWHQSYISIPGPSWGGWVDVAVSALTDRGHWVDNISCDLRLIYEDPGHLYGPSPVVPNTQSELDVSNIVVPTQVTGMDVLYPVLDKENQIHLPVNVQTLIIIKILSGSNATSSWSAPVSRTGVAFLKSCPEETFEIQQVCQRDSPDAWFSYTYVMLTWQGEQTLNITASNPLNSQTLSLKLQAHFIISGLRIQPEGFHRVLVDIPKMFTAEVASGSSVKYTWVIDNLVQFAHVGRSYSVVFNTSAEHTLKVTAENPVSTRVTEVRLTADVMTPLSELSLLSEIKAVAVNTSTIYTVQVKLDVSIGVTIRWDFGDGSSWVNHAVVAPLERNDIPLDRTVTQIYRQDAAHHTYTTPGDYTVRIQAQNQYDFIQRAVLLKVRCPLTNLLILSKSALHKVNQTVLFEASSQPSSYGVVYMWDFGDGSSEVVGPLKITRHTFKQAGVFNVSVCSNNTLSELNSWVAVEVFEAISGVWLRYNGPSELNSVTEISGGVSTGTGLRWTFDLGDGTVFKDLERNSVAHVYRSVGNYTVQVTVWNAMSSVRRSLGVEIYRLAVVGILPTECVMSEKEVNLQALVRGNVSQLAFHWSFQESTGVSIMKGTPTIAHRFSGPGSYIINVTIYSLTGSAHYQTSRCVEASIANLNLHTSVRVAALGEEICFNVSTVPSGFDGFRFLWYNSSSCDCPMNGTSHHCFVFSKEGQHEVRVIARNWVSEKSATTTVVIQRPVAKLSIQHNGDSDVFTVNRSYYFWTEPSQSNVGIEWDFGDGSLKCEGHNLSHVFTSAGYHHISVSVYNAVSKEILVVRVEVQVPISNVVIRTNQPFAEEDREVVFTASSDVMDDVEFYWIVESLTHSQLGTSEYKYVFPEAGVFRVRVMVQNSVSQLESSTTVEVLERIQNVQIISHNLKAMRSFATNETVTLIASVNRGTSLVYQWLAHQDGVDDRDGIGEHFRLCTSHPGNVSVKLIAANALGKVYSNVSLRAVERISGVNISSPLNIMVKGEPIKIGVTMKTGSDLQYIWFLDPDGSPTTTDVPFVLHVFNTIGVFNLSVSVENVLGSVSATKRLIIQEPVSEIDFELNGRSHPYFIASNTLVKFHGSARKGNDLRWKWTAVSWEGGEVVLGKNQTISYSFTNAGDHRVILNVSNEISWHSVSRFVTVQEAIKGLRLRVIDAIVCENDPVTFKPSVSQGSGISFDLEFPGGNISLKHQMDLTTSSIPVGSHTIRVTAKNLVSDLSANITVKVVERVKGLHLIDCCSSVLEASKPVTFKASVRTGSNVTYLWNFILDGFKPLQQTGQNVIYVPLSNGSLSVTVEARTDFCSQSMTETAQVQRPVRNMNLSILSDGPFVDLNVTFFALIDGGSDLVFKWDFGDPNEGIRVTKSNKEVYKYKDEGRFMVQVTVFNNISQVLAHVPVRVRKLECTQPRVTLIQEQTQIFKSRPNYFEASVILNSCTSYRTNYLWEIFTDPDCTEKKKVFLNGSVDVKTPLLTLPNHSLQVGDYCLKFTTWFEGTPLRHHKTTGFSVVNSPLVPLIKGGSFQMWSNQKDLVLDGTESYDPDATIQEVDLFQFHWDIAMEQNSNTSHCPASFLRKYPIQHNSSKLILPRHVLEPDRVYHFILTIQKPGRSPVSTLQQVQVHKTEVLPVTVTCVSCRLRSSSSVSHSHPLALTGHCPLCNGVVQYKWTAEDTKREVLHLNEVTTSTGHSAKDLVIRPSVLKPGFEYIFRLNVSQPETGLWGSASVALTLNHPPKAGNCTLSPEDTVQLLQNTVSFNCSGWVDEKSSPAQLIYSLHVARCETPETQCPLITLYRGTQRTFRTLVPLGSTRLGHNASIITVMVTIEDNMGAKVTAIKRNLIVVVPVRDQDTVAWLKKKSQEELWALMKQGNPQEVIPYATALTSPLNQVKANNMQAFMDKVQLRSNVTLALASLSVSSIQDAAQISSALAHSTAITSELQCGDCNSQVVEAMEKMITVIREQTRQGDVTPIDTGRNILNILSNSMSVQIPANASGLLSHPIPHQDTAISAFYQVGQLMRSLLWSRMPGEEALSIKSSQIKAVGKRGDPTSDFLCTDPSSPCQFHIPSNLTSQLRTETQDIVQIVLFMENEQIPFISVADPPISTTLSALEFATPQGRPIPIANLTAERAIRVTLENRKIEVSGRVNVTLPSEGSANFTVGAVETEPDAGLFIAFNFSLIKRSDMLNSGKVIILVADEQTFQRTHVKELTLALSSPSVSVEETFFLTPVLNGSAKDLYVTLENGAGVELRASVCVFSSLCRFFDMEQRRWSTEGLSVLSTSSPGSAHCLTRHLTLFGASLFVHPDAVVLLAPADGPSRNMVVGIVCGVLLAIHLLVGLIAHKLDHLEILRLSCIPLCGQSGRYRYRVLVKTGWYRGAGTSAHVGISLHGLNKSGSRHLRREGAFQRNALDDFQVETDVNLGEIWKICVWHDNTGLDPSWYLQQVTVWDMQTDHMFFFLVEDWLSVENEENSGLVQKVVLATCPAELRRFGRIFRAQLLYGLQDHHLWLSLWERPAHSTFSRAQRVTCCALILHLYLAAGAVWYGSVATASSGGPVADQMPMTPETILVGMTIAVVIFPLQSLLTFLFRKTKSKVAMQLSLPPSPMSDVVEMDVYLSQPDMSCASFLSMPTGHESASFDGSSFEDLEGPKLESVFWDTSRVRSDSPCSSRVDQWTSSDSIVGLAETTGPTRLLKRKRALLHVTLNSPAHELSTTEHSRVDPNLKNHQPRSSEEESWSICADPFFSSAASSRLSTCDSGRYSPNGTALSDTPESSSSEWMELSIEKSDRGAELYKSHCSVSVCSVASTFLPSLPPDSFSTTSPTHIGVSRSDPGLMLPSWVLGVVYLLATVLLGTCLTFVGLYGSTFSNSVLLMWFTSVLSAFFTSVVVLEPLMMCLRAMYLACVVKPVDPEVENRLAQEAGVMKMETDKGVKVRPLCGYGLLHAREEAQKVRILRNLMKNCLIYMLFLFVVLMMNYQDNLQETNSRLLHPAVKRSIISPSPGQPNLTALSGWTDVWQWMDQSLTAHLHNNPSLSLIGLARLQRTNFCGSNSEYGQTLMMLSAQNSGRLRPRHRSNSAATVLSWPWSTAQSCVSSETDRMLLGNNSVFTRHILSGLKQAHWITVETQAVLVEFTQYHRETGLFLPVSILLEKSQTPQIVSTISIQAFYIPGSFSGLELNIATMSLMLIFSLGFLSAEVWRMLRDRAQYLPPAWRLFQFLVAVVSFSAASLRLWFLSMATACLSDHLSHPDSFSGFHSTAALARSSSRLSAVLLMFLVPQMAGSLQFVRRWMVFSRVLCQSFSEMCGIILLLVLLLLLFSHTGSLLFSASVEGFRNVRQAGQSVLCLWRNRIILKQLSEEHPVLGPLFCFAVFGPGFWFLGRLCGAVLLHRYKTIRAEMYRPSMEPQDYEMIEFFVKRLKLWMGFSKIKEFRHRVKFEGMESPPSRSSECSQLSSPISPPGTRLVSSASSQVSEASTISEIHEVQQHLDRLLPSVESLLAGFDRVNQLTDDVLKIEQQLQKVQSRIVQNRKKQAEQPQPQKPPSPKLTRSSQASLRMGPKTRTSSLFGITHVLPHRRATHSESSLLGPSAHTMMYLSLTGRLKSQPEDLDNKGFPRQRASGSCHSADTIQRIAKSRRPGNIPVRPHSEERDRTETDRGMPIKKRAWPSDPSEIEKD